MSTTLAPQSDLEKQLSQKENAELKARMEEEEEKLNESSDSVVQPNEINPSAQLRMDILKAFGADLDTNMRENLLFVNKALIYPCGKHLTLRDLSERGENDTHKNEQLFIFMENEVKEINCLNVSNDGYLLLVSTETADTAEINVYNLSKISFSSFTIFKPRRKIITSNFSRFIFGCFTQDGNTLCVLGETKDNLLKGLIYDIQAFKKFQKENYSPKYEFEVPRGANKVSFLNNKIFCVSGKNCLSFWHCYENNCKEFKSTVNLAKNYVDHCWIYDPKCPSLAVVTDTNDLFIYNAVFFKTNMAINEEDINQPIERFAIKQTLTNIFNITSVKENYIYKHRMKDTESSLFCTKIKCYEDGIIIGSNKGNVLFVEKLPNGDYLPTRYSFKDTETPVIGLCLENLGETVLVVGYASNEIAYVNLKDILNNIKNTDFTLEFNLLCDGFHRGAISSMDVSLQRPIILTCSKEDRSIRIWNYLTGHCENCKIIMDEKEDSQENEINFLALAIHPNGYYVAVSDAEMIRFFHLCYKELRYYCNDQVGNEQNKANCTILKFSTGGHLLAAVAERKIYIIRSFSRETLRIFSTPHKGNIVSIYFHEEDQFIYSCGSDGIIVQYNLFNFDMVKITTRLNSYNDSVICQNYLKYNKYKQKIAQIDNIASVGYSTSGDYMISNLRFEAQKTEEMSQCKYTYGFIDEHGFSCCHIHTKRYDIQSVAVGTVNGKVCLYSKRILNDPEERTEKPDSEFYLPKFDSILSHSKKVNFLYFSRDTNLLFSAGEDGNIFIYAIYEYPDGECAAFDENRLVSVGQLNSILDEGLGDNVLMSLNVLNNNQEKVSNKQEEITKLKKTSEESTKMFEKQLEEKEEELNRQRKEEIEDLKKKIEEMTVSRNNLIVDYEKKIEDTSQEHRKRFNEREATTNIKIEELHKQIEELKKLNDTMEKDYKKILKENNNDQLMKFKELEYFLKKNIDDLNNKNLRLEKNIEEAKNNEIKQLRIIEDEHENELKLKEEKFNEVMAKSKKELEDKINIISKLSEKIGKLEKSLQTNENNIRQYREDNEHLTDNVIKLKEMLKNREYEKEKLTKKMTELEENYQEKSKLESFSNQLKNELYKKNYELSAKFNKEVANREELKDTSKTLENQLEDTINLLINREKEILRNKRTINEYKEKLEQQRKETVFAQKDFDTLLKKIYDTFQTNHKKDILTGIKEIYKEYVAGDSKKYYEAGKININVRIELEKQIEHLQNELDSKNEICDRKGKSQVVEFHKKMQENVMLIQEMTKIKKLITEMGSQIKNLKYRNTTLSQTIQRFRDSKKYGKLGGGDKEEDGGGSTVLFNNQSNLNFPSGYSGHQINTSCTGGNVLYGNNSSSISTLPSDALPFINNSGGSLKNMKNRIYKPWDRKNLGQEKLLKFNEMKKIIENKNDIIQRLATENDFLKKSFGKPPKIYSSCNTNK